MKSAVKQNSIDEYIRKFPEEIQQKLQQIRNTVKSVVPEGEELISYQIPAIKLHHVLVYYGVFKNHIGFFPTPSAIEKFDKELSSYKTSKGTVRFPLNKKIPLELISSMTKFRYEAESKYYKKIIIKETV